MGSWSHRDPLILTLTLSNERIAATPEHPFFVVGQGWTAAGDLRIGDAMQQLDGTTDTLRAITVEYRP
ncbi:hypothetical protein HC891_20185 [Candidatus Gracilibacteria bacterium]|nr:hypothetical protein [Candidatus Gracilibacteria bacterium]